jgi:hypothetical protein
VLQDLGGFSEYDVSGSHGLSGSNVALSPRTQLDATNTMHRTPSVPRSSREVPPNGRPPIARLNSRSGALSNSSLPGAATPQAPLGTAAASGTPEADSTSFKSVGSATNHSTLGANHSTPGTNHSTPEADSESLDEMSMSLSTDEAVGSRPESQRGPGGLPPAEGSATSPPALAAEAPFNQPAGSISVQHLRSPSALVASTGDTDLQNPSSNDQLAPPGRRSLADGGSSGGTGRIGSGDAGMAQRPSPPKQTSAEMCAPAVLVMHSIRMHGHQSHLQHGGCIVACLVLSLPKG